MACILWDNTSCVLLPPCCSSFVLRLFVCLCFSMFYLISLSPHIHIHIRRVFTTVSTAAKAKLAKSYGADVVIRYTTTDFAEVVLKGTNGKGVNVVYGKVAYTHKTYIILCIKWS